MIVWATRIGDPGYLAYTMRPDVAPVGCDLDKGGASAWAWSDSAGFCRDVAKASVGYDAPGHLEAALVAAGGHARFYSPPAGRWEVTP